jgi:hypothetical protein
MSQSRINFSAIGRGTQPARSDVLMLSAASQANLVQYVKLAYQAQVDITDHRQRLEEIDRAYLREKDYTEEQRKAQAANRRGDPTKLQNMQVPLVLEAVENGASFLTQVFLTEYPIFKFGSGPENSEVVTQWNTLIGEDQIHYSWVVQFNIAFRNSEKYNFAPIECDWCEEVIYKPQNGAGVNGAVLAKLIWQGNKIEAHDPYNTIYDKRVAVARNHIDGEYGGYTKNMTRTQLKRFIHSLGEDRLKNDKAAYESPIGEIDYYIPDINPRARNRAKGGTDDNFNWELWATGNNTERRINYKNTYRVTTLYARLMPGEFGIRAPNDQTPEVWKLIVVNGNVLIYARPITAAHDFLPLIIVQSQSDHLDTQNDSNAETQQVFQEMVSSLWNAKLQSARRRVTDRMLYNPLLVEPDHINSPNPSAKIPVKGIAYGRKLEEAVYQIPFHDENSQYWLQEVQGIAEWGLRAQGHNRVSAGQFQKGNKLVEEFQTVMANAGSRDRTKAIMWENNGMMPIKAIIKSNTLQKLSKTTRYNRETNESIEIDPVKLREAEADFNLGDGLLPVERMIGSDTLQQFLNYLGTDPAAAAEFNRGDMLVYLMQLRGATQLNKFKKPPEVIQYEQALMTWKSLGEILAKNPNFQPQMIAQALGPMPQPPGAPQQQQQQQQTPQQVPQQGM